MTSQDIIKLGDDNIMPTYSRFQVAIERGEGATLYDFDGKKYVDFSSGIGVNSVGYGNKKWCDAVTTQAGKLQHISNLFYSEPAAQLAKTLKERSGMSNVFFSNSGAEANEGLIKLARKYSFDKYGPGRSGIVTLVNSFHGRTVTTLSATGQDVFHNYFFPFTEGFSHAPAGDLDAVKAACGDDVCAVMVELIQGEGGVLPLEKDFVRGLKKLCDERDILLLVDEVQTGVGRTGTLFAYMQYGITPDAVSFAKGIAGGLPFGGFMAGEKCKDILGPGMHATTFGGNPVAAAAAGAVLEILSDDELSEITKKGEYVRGKLEAMKLDCVTSVRGLGLMIGVGVSVPHKELASKLTENGLLALTAGSDTIRLLPPLTISYAELDEGLGILRATLERTETV